VSAKSPYRSLAEIVEKGKAIPNTLKFVSVGRARRTTSVSS
jgi:hypothetical protein